MKLQSPREWGLLIAESLLKDSTVRRGSQSKFLASIVLLVSLRHLAELGDLDYLTDPCDCRYITLR